MLFRSPPGLPIAERRDDLVAALRDHQVVVVAGDTGSGKSTQLPKICLDIGRQRIGHTQPRRVAARTIAQRIADETATPLGGLIGYSVRFNDRVGPDTRPAPHRTPRTTSAGPRGAAVAPRPSPARAPRDRRWRRR